MTHSQYGQDDEIVKFFNKKTDGYFLDIGAHNDGHDTVLLENMGWSGICVEPLDDQFEMLRKNRKCICRKLCIGDKNGEVEFASNEGYTAALSGVVEYYCDAHQQRILKEINEMGGEMNVGIKEMKTLTTLLEEEDAPTHIELLKIDVEGGEYAVLSGVDFSKYTFDLITLEGNYQEEVDRCVALLSNHGYNPFMKVGIDIFFRRHDESQ
jgi:FkbM family methyltransferase